MPDDKTGASTQTGAGAGATGAADDQASQGTQNTQDTTQTAQTGMSAAQLEAELTATRKEAAKWRTQYQDVKKKADDLTAGATDTEKLRSELDTIKSQMQAASAATKSAAMVSAAARSGALRPDAVARLMDASAVEPDKAGTYPDTAFDTALAEVKKSCPELFRASRLGGDAGANGKATTSQGMNELIRRATGHSA